MTQAPGRRAPLYRLSKTIQQAFVETLPDIQLRIRRDGEVLAMEVPASTGLPESCAWRGPLEAHLGAADAGRWVELVARCLDSGEVQTDTQGFTLFGRPLRFEVRLSVAGEDEVLAFARDISAREEALRRLEANHRLVSEIAQNFPGSLYVIDVATGRAVYTNRSFLELLGYDRTLADLSIGAQLDLILGPAERAEVAAHAREIVRAPDEVTQEFEVEVRDAQGRGRTMRVRTRVFSRAADGRAQDVFCVVEDITDRRVAKERLRHGQKLELLGQLAGVVVHDFNNIITSVRGFAELLVEDLPAGSPAEADAQIIIAAMERAAGVARRLLAFSRNEATRPRVVDVAEGLNRMVPLLRGVVGERYQVEVQLRAIGVRALIDPVDLEQCVVNLVVNARDALPRGGAVNVSLSARAQGERREVCIAVSDQGTGIDPVVRDRLFEPFFTTKASGQGTGLGLASVQRIMAAAQGRVEVESELGVGSTFTLVLPLHEGADAVDDGAAATRAPKVPRARILVVEDDELVRRLVVDALTRDGHAVRSAADAEGALVIARGESFDLVVSDVVMPATSGPALVAQLRELQSTLRVIFTSGYYENQELDPRSVEGARMLPKPFGPDDLLDAVRYVLSA